MKDLKAASKKKLKESEKKIDISTKYIEKLEKDIKNLTVNSNKQKDVLKILNAALTASQNDLKDKTLTADELENTLSEKLLNITSLTEDKEKLARKLTKNKERVTDEKTKRPAEAEELNTLKKLKHYKQ